MNIYSYVCFILIFVKLINLYLMSPSVSYGLHYVLQSNLLLLYFVGPGFNPGIE